MKVDEYKTELFKKWCSLLYLHWN